MLTLFQIHNIFVLVSMYYNTIHCNSSHDCNQAFYGLSGPTLLDFMNLQSARRQVWAFPIPTHFIRTVSELNSMSLKYCTRQCGLVHIFYLDNLGTLLITAVENAQIGVLCSLAVLLGLAGQLFLQLPDGHATNDRPMLV